MTTGALTALLADDVADLRRLYRLVLERTGRFVVVGEAGDGAAAVELAREHQPNLVLLDVSMPILDGLEALPRILSVSPSSRVVMLTGFSADRLAPTALQRGAVGYLEKGLTPAQLVTEVLALLGEPGHEDRGRASAAGAGAPANGHAASAPPAAAIEQAMLSVVAHEIRNPLNIVQGFASILEKDWERLDPADARHFVERIASNTRYLDGVVRALLTLGSLESGDALLDVRDWDPVELVEELLPVLRDEHPERRIALQVLGQPPVSRVDAERFRQVLSNLVTNADRYSPAGTPVTVTVRSEDGTASVCVGDEGPGIPPEEREHVFERFVRLEQGGGGVGLGLYISRLLMTAMGGTIRVEESATGARICCRLAPAREAA